MCFPCKTLIEISIDLQDHKVRSGAIDTFFKFVTCTHDTDSTFVACSPIVTGGRLTGDARDFDEACEFECDVGFHAEADTCVQCPDLPAGHFYVDNLCSVACNESLGFYDPPNNRAVVSCLDCSSSCDNGRYHRRRDDACECEDCLHLMRGENWQFMSAGKFVDDAYSCDIECVDNHFLDFTICRPYSEVVCQDHEFVIPATPVSDTSCQACRYCMGQNKTRECNGTHDTVCSPCPLLTNGMIYIDDECSATCARGFVYNRILEQCEQCSHVCEKGAVHPPDELRDNCTHCVSCDPPPPSNAIVFENTCRWACPLGFVFETSTCVEETLSIFQRSRRSGGYGCQPILCWHGHIPVAQIDACSKCMPCAGSGVSMPPLQQENITWTWKRGFVCDFECLEGYLRFTEGNAVLCLTQAEYDAKIQVLMRTEDFATASWTTHKTDKGRISWILIAVVVLVSVCLSIIVMCL